MPSFPAVLGWSSGCFSALASDEPLLFLYEPPLGADRDASLTQRLEFLRTLTWSAIGAHRRARAAFWRMVTQRLAEWMLSVLRASPASPPSTPRTGVAG